MTCFVILLRFHCYGFLQQRSVVDRLLYTAHRVTSSLVEPRCSRDVRGANVRSRRLPDENPGPPLPQWLGVTLLLALAFFALLQVIGPSLSGFLNRALEFVRSLIS